MIPQAQKLNIFLSNLLECHNLVTLLNARKSSLDKEDKNYKEDLFWYWETAKELKKVNDKLLSHVDEFLFLTDFLEKTIYDKQFFVLEPNYTDSFYNFLPMRMEMLRRQNKAAFNMLKNDSDSLDIQKVKFKPSKAS